MFEFDLIGQRHVVTSPSAQLALLEREDCKREWSGIRAILLRENAEKTSGTVSTAPHKESKKSLRFIAENGKTFLLPLRHLSISRAADMLTIAIDEKAMIENCTLYGLWDSCYFSEMPQIAQ